MAQALAACQAVVGPSRSVHQLSCHFLKGGDVSSDICFETTRLSSGRAFEVIHARALQSDGPILSMTASFQSPEAGFEHTFKPGLQPEWSRPDHLKSIHEHMAPVLERVPPKMRALFTPDTTPFDVRPNIFISPYDCDQHAPSRAVWLRAREPLSNDLRVHQRLLTYMSDWNLLGTSLLPHPTASWVPQMQIASLSHSIHFHREFRIDDWLCHVMRSPSASGGRGFALGEVWTEDGVLVASTAQEGLIRFRGVGGSGAKGK